MAREQTRRFRNVGNAIAAVLSHRNQFGSESLTLEGLASGSSCRLSKHSRSGFSRTMQQSESPEVRVFRQYRIHAKQKRNEIPRSYSKCRLQSGLLFNHMSTFTNASKTWSAFSQKPTFLARMGSSYITPHALFCPGAYSQLSKPYRFGAPTSFYSLLLVSFLS